MLFMFSELGISTTFLTTFTTLWILVPGIRGPKDKETLQEFHTICGIQIEAAIFEIVVDKQEKVA